MNLSENLNLRGIEDEFQYDRVNRKSYICPSPNNNTTSSNGEFSVYFRDIEEELILKINQYPIVVGCIAWLTNKRILKALATKERVCIIVQKEDFLRPDTDNWTGKNLKKLYKLLPKGVTKNMEAIDYSWGSIIPFLNTNGCMETSPIRWVGNFNTEKRPAFPRMHNKFLVFCDTVERRNYDYGDVVVMKKIIIPRAVWTGSFNITDNATRSLENALYSTNSEIVEAYYDEWEHIFSLSENIDDEDWCVKWEIPYFRIGT